MKMLSNPNEYIILGLIVLLSSFGIVMMYSASSIYAMNTFDNYMFFLIQQIKWLILGIILMLITSQINYQVFKRLAYGLLLFSWIVMIMGYLFKGNNPAARWLVIGGRSWMTTSDLARVSLIIFTASFTGVLIMATLLLGCDVFLLPLLAVIPPPRSSMSSANLITPF